MRMRALGGRHPVSGQMGLWIARDGYDCRTDDRTDRNKFLISTDFAGRKPMRIIKAGITASNTPIFLATALAQLGGEPMLTYRVMTDGANERANAYYGAQNDGRGGGYGGTEFLNRFFDGNPAYFLIQATGAPASTAYLLRYMVALF
jgi:hypothetical protein